MKQLVSMFVKKEHNTNYVEYTLTADECDVLNYFYSIKCEDDLAKQILGILKGFVQDEVIDMKEIVALGKKFDGMIYNREDIIEMIRGYFACFDIHGTFSIQADYLNNLRRAINTSNIKREDDISSFDQSVISASSNTEVFDQCDIYFNGIDKRESLETEIKEPFIVEETKVQKKKA